MTDLDESALLGDRAETPLGPIDESVLDIENENLHENGRDIKEEDLYDDVIAPSNTSFDGSSTTVVNATQQENKPKPAATSTSTQMMASSTSSGTYGRDSDRKFCCYVGNLTWWATDVDLMMAIESCGVPRAHFTDLKFFENRTNGQSKGFALIVFTSDQAVRHLMEQLPSKSIHGQNPMVLPYNKQSLTRLEDSSKKIQTRPDTKSKKEESCVNMGTIRIGGGPPPGPMGPPMMMLGGPRNGPPMGGPMNMMNMRGGPGPNGPMMGGGGPLGQAPPVRMQLNMNGQPGNQPPMMNARPQPLMATPQLPPPSMAPQANSITQQLLGAIAQQPPSANPAVQLRGIVSNIPNMSTAPPVPMGMQQQQPMINAPPANIAPFMPQGPPPNMHSRPAPTQYNQPMQGGYQNAPQPLMNINTAMKPPQHGMPPVHVNPQMFPGIQGMGMGQGGPQMTGADFEEVMNRNRTVSSSAISRAVADAASGDYKSATETLLTAIALIKQSPVTHDDRCRLLISSLEDTLKGIESKAYTSGGSRSKHRDRSRSRERDRKRRRRSRTRSRSDSRSPSPHRSRRRY